jgi:SAM-dependent methyltransferase
MFPKEAIHSVVRRFPFPEYMTAGIGTGVYEHIANIALRYLDPGSKILDFGCGPCDKTAILQVLGYQCYCIDDLQDDWHRVPGNRDKILDFAKDFGIDFRLPNYGLSSFDKNTFDMIMLHGVLEHLHDSPRDILNDLLELAKPQGLLFITVPNAVNIRKRIDVIFGKTNLPRFDGYYWYPGAWRGHIREYVRDDLVKLSNYLNLELLELNSCDHMIHKLPTVVRPIYLFATNFFRGWKDSWVLVASKRVNWVPRKVLPNDELTRILRKNSSYGYV